MTDKARQRSINTVVDGIMASSKGLIDDDHYELIFEYVIRGLTDINTNHSMWSPTYSKQTPGSINEITLPTDAEEIIGIAVPVNGKIWWLTRDDAIITTTTTDGGSETQDSDSGEGVDLATSASYNMFSRAKNPEGYYTIDRQNSRIMLNSISDSRTEVILVYKSSGISSDTYVPNKFLEAVESYVYMRYFGTPDVPANQRDMYIRQYNAAVVKLKQHQLNMIDIIATIRESYMMLPTR